MSCPSPPSRLEEPRRRLILSCFVPLRPISSRLILFSTPSLSLEGSELGLPCFGFARCPTHDRGATCHLAAEATSAHINFYAIVRVVLSDRMARGFRRARHRRVLGIPLSLQERPTDHGRIAVDDRLMPVASLDCPGWVSPGSGSETVLYDDASRHPVAIGIPQPGVFRLLASADVSALRVCPVPCPRRQVAGDTSHCHCRRSGHQCCHSYRVAPSDPPVGMMLRALYQAVIEVWYGTRGNREGTSGTFDTRGKDAKTTLDDR